MWKKTVLICSAALMLGACSGVKSAQVEPVKPSDKQLSCTDIELEINEAKFWRDKADANRGLNLRNVVHPLGYGSTLMSSADAMDSAETRMAYLQQIYAIRHCAEMQNQAVNYRYQQRPAYDTPASYNSSQGYPRQF